MGWLPTSTLADSGYWTGFCDIRLCERLVRVSESLSDIVRSRPDLLASKIRRGRGEPILLIRRVHNKYTSKDTSLRWVRWKTSELLLFMPFYTITGGFNFEKRSKTVYRGHRGPSGLPVPFFRFSAGTSGQLLNRIRFIVCIFFFFFTLDT